MVYNDVTDRITESGFKFRSITLFIFAFLFLLSNAAQASSGIVELTQAELAISNTDHLPQTAQWRPVKLMHHWTAQDYTQGRNGWYRLVIDLPRLPDERWGIYLRRFNMNAAVYLNGQFLADGGRFDEPLSRNWNRPLYVAVPAILWQPGENVILIRLKSYAAYGSLAPVFVGSARVLDVEYARQTLFQLDISQMLFPIMVVIGLFIFALWVRRREDVQYLWFSLAVLMWSIFSLNMFTRDQPFSTKTWEWIAHSSLDWWVILFGIFIYRFISKPHPYLERAYFLFGFAACLVYALVDLEGLSAATRWIHGGSILIGFIVLVGLIQAAWSEKNRLYTKLAVGLVLLLLLGINDWMFQYQVSSVTGPIGLHLHHYLSPFIFLFMAWHLTGRFSAALQEAETLNHDLEERVMQAQHEIEQHYQTIQKIENQKAVLQERERLSHEIHDGISGNVSNAIMMTELIRREAPSEGGKRLQQLRSHLDDGLCEMRNLILTMAEDISNVSELISHISDKYEQVLGPLDVEYSVALSLHNGQRTLSAKQSLNLLRIFQEALNNIAKHAQATQVLLRVTEEVDSIIFEVSDNGHGFDMTQSFNGHYGLGNMRKRSCEIGADLMISSSAGQGTQVQLRLPLGKL